VNIDYIIIGQGISGTCLSYILHKHGKSCVVIDNNNPSSSSRIAAGVINPVTGRRHVKVWMAEEIISNTWQFYKELGEELSVEIIKQKDIIDFFPSAQMRLSFSERSNEDDSYVSIGKDDNPFRKDFHFDFGFGKISPVYMVQLDALLPSWRKQLSDNNSLLEEDLEIELLKIEKDHISYKDIQAQKIIFCDGINSMNYSFFQKLPFAFNKGEMLLLEIKDLPPGNIYKKGLMLAPLSNDLWWIGSNYQWEYENAQPSPAFRESTENTLKNWLKVPYKILDHKASLRPATIERRPFVGLHPHHPSIGILNGMGTKGCSLAPWFAKQFAEHLINGKPIDPEASINRFSRLLSA